MTESQSVKTSELAADCRKSVGLKPSMAAAMAATLLLISFLGCGRPKTTATVSGVISLDGEPLESGAISFYPISGGSTTAAQSAGATIDKGGRYRTEILPGRFRVEISSSRSVGQRKRYEDLPDSPMDDILKEVVPAVYNTSSSLERDISLDTKTLDFVLQSKPSVKN
jgi:hypothetical protein